MATQTHPSLRPKSRWPARLKGLLLLLLLAWALFAPTIAFIVSLFKF